MHELLFDFISQYVTLNEEEKETIIALDLFRTVKKNTVLLRENEVSNLGYFVLKGCIRTYYMVDGDERTTAFYTELEGHTPQCVIDNKPSKYFLATVEDSILSVSNPQMETEIFEKFPKFESLCRILSEELIVKQALDLDQFKISNPEQRYIQLLETRPDLVQRVPQHQLASYLGIKPQSLSRIRSRLIHAKK